MLEFYLYIYYNYKQNNQYFKLILAEFSYNNSIYTIISYSLFRLLYSFNLKLSINIKNNISKGEALAAADRIKILNRNREYLVKYF